MTILPIVLVGIFLLSELCLYSLMKGFADHIFEKCTLVFKVGSWALLALTESFCNGELPNLKEQILFLIQRICRINQLMLTKISYVLSFIFQFLLVTDLGTRYGCQISIFFLKRTYAGTFVCCQAMHIVPAWNMLPS